MDGAPRRNSATQLTGELDALLRLGWRKDVFVVDDNFIGNHKAALELVHELERWQSRNGYPFGFFTEASIDLASRPALLEGMVKANFWRVFIGIESPSVEALKETKKFQNLRRDLMDSIHFIQQRGLWVMGGFIVGFDSDPPDIFDRQIEFVERAAIPWAMTGILQAPPTTPLYERMKKMAGSSKTSPSRTTLNPRTSEPCCPFPNCSMERSACCLRFTIRNAFINGCLIPRTVAASAGTERLGDFFAVSVEGAAEICLEARGDLSLSWSLLALYAWADDALGPAAAEEAPRFELAPPVTTSFATRDKSPTLWKLKAGRQFSSCIRDLFPSRMDKRRIWCRSIRASCAT